MGGHACVGGPSMWTSHEQGNDVSTTFGPTLSKVLDLAACHDSFNQWYLSLISFVFLREQTGLLKGRHVNYDGALESYILWGVSRLGL